MARKYSRGASKEVKNEMHRYKRGKAKSGKGGKGGLSKTVSRLSLLPFPRRGRRAKKSQTRRLLDLIRPHSGASHRLQSGFRFQTTFDL
jgi:hypothetical protein